MTDPTLDDVVELGERILARCRDAGCTCKPAIHLDHEDGYWYADVTHRTGCPHQAPDEYVEGI